MPSAAARRKEQEKKKAATTRPKSAGGQSSAATVAAAVDGTVPDVMLVFPPTLTPRQRAVLHELGEAHGLSHESQGTGNERHIELGHPRCQKVVVVSDLLSLSPGQALSDAQLCELLRRQLSLDARGTFGSGAPSKPASSKSQPPPRTQKPEPPSASASAHVDVDAWVRRMVECVELERSAEVQAATESSAMCSPETAQARGRALLNLRVSDLEGGLLGRTLIKLVSNKGWSGVGAGPELPPHKFGTHDVVALRPNKGPNDGPPLCSGVIYRVHDNALVVAVDEAPEEGMDQPLRLEKLANEVTYKRLKATLGSLARVAMGATGGGPTPGAGLVDVAFRGQAPRFVDPAPPWQPVNPRLDDSQRAAVSLALAAKDVALIHGPPGTGKTTAVVEVIVQELARGSRVLAVAASNIAVDNLVERVVAAAGPKARVLRMGHPARLLPQVLDSCLEAHVFKSDSSALARDCRKEIKALNQQLLKLGSRDRAERRAIRGDLRRLAGEERARQEAAVTEVVAGARVVASTLTGLLHRHLDGQVFDVVVIDEAAQAVEAACWEALLRAPRAVLAGDHLQLPPTVVSEAAAARGLGVTLFERLHAAHGSGSAAMLTVQYRMNAAIMDWSSQALYEGRLTAHESVADHDVQGLLSAAPVSAASTRGKASKGAAATQQGSSTIPGSGSSPIPVLLLVDTAGCGFEEAKEEEGDSKRNEGEAKAVMAHVQRLVRAGLAPRDIGVITPYNAQVALLREMRSERLQSVEISSVDGFQGREKEAIVISMVRSNTNGDVGFLADRRRMNVAVTRARRHVALVADSETVGRDPFLAGLLAHFEAHGEYASAQELVDEAEAAAATQ